MCAVCVCGGGGGGGEEIAKGWCMGRARFLALEGRNHGGGESEIPRTPVIMELKTLHLVPKQ